MSQNFIEVPDYFEFLEMPSSPPINLEDQHFKAINHNLENITDKSIPIIFPGKIFVEHIIPITSKEKFAKKIEELIKDGYQIEIAFDPRMV